MLRETGPWAISCNDSLRCEKWPAMDLGFSYLTLLHCQKNYPVWVVTHAAWDGEEGILTVIIEIEKFLCMGLKNRIINQ